MTVAFVNVCDVKANNGLTKDSVNSLVAFCNVAAATAFITTIVLLATLGAVPEMIPAELTATPPGNPEIAAYVTLPAPCVAVTVLLKEKPTSMTTPSCPDAVVQAGGAHRAILAFVNTEPSTLRISNGLIVPSVAAGICVRISVEEINVELSVTFPRFAIAFAANADASDTIFTKPPALETARWFVSPVYVEFDTTTLPAKFLKNPEDNWKVFGASCNCASVADTVKEYDVVEFDDSMMLPVKLPFPNNDVPGGRLEPDASVYVNVESPLASAKLRANVRVFVDGASVPVASQIGDTLHVTALAKTADVPSVLITNKEYVPGATPVNRARSCVWEIPVVAEAATDPSIATAPAPNDDPKIVRYDDSPNAVSSNATPSASVTEKLEIVMGDTGGARPVIPWPLPTRKDAETLPENVAVCPTTVFAETLPVNVAVCPTTVFAETLPENVAVCPTTVFAVTVVAVIELRFAVGAVMELALKLPGTLALLPDETSANGCDVM